MWDRSLSVIQNKHVFEDWNRCFKQINVMTKVDSYHVFVVENHSLVIIAVLNLYAYCNCKWRLTLLTSHLPRGMTHSTGWHWAIPNQQPMKGDEYET